jgi:phage-related minor tail protein
MAQAKKPETSAPATPATPDASQGVEHRLAAAETTVAELAGQVASLTDAVADLAARYTAVEQQLAAATERLHALERLDVACPSCGGSRVVTREGEQRPCRVCDGVGTVLTERGERIRRLSQSPREPLDNNDD